MPHFWFSYLADGRVIDVMLNIIMPDV
jgi:hypothetical protein